MKLLTPGTGNQRSNRKIAMEFIAEKLFPGSDIEPKTGTLTIPTGGKIHVSAYAESAKAMISTPGTDISKHSIYESGYDCLMFRQLKDGRAIIYWVDPSNIDMEGGTTSADWDAVKNASSKYWICRGDEIREMGGT